MFPEYRELISRLKTEDLHFGRLFERHNELDHEIARMESGITPAEPLAIAALKKEKLLLKDRLREILRREAG